MTSLFFGMVGIGLRFVAWIGFHGRSGSTSHGLAVEDLEHQVLFIELAVAFYTQLICYFPKLGYQHLIETKYIINHKKSNALKIK